MSDLFQDSPSNSWLGTPPHQTMLEVAVCPGFHNPGLTAALVRSLPPFVQAHVLEAFPANPVDVFQQLTEVFGDPRKSKRSLVAIGFSGGVVGLAGALAIWQQQGGKIALLLAVDGWGVPLVGLPVCRLSHDAFTHWSSLPLGAGKVNFYADPPVEHLDLWSLMTQATGWQVNGLSRQAMTASAFLARQLEQQLAAIANTV